MSEPHFNPRSMEWVASKLMEPAGLPVNGSVETCQTVFPSVELGTYQRPDDLVLSLFVYATITRANGIEWRGAYVKSVHGVDRVARCHVDEYGLREWL